MGDTVNSRPPQPVVPDEGAVGSPERDLRVIASRLSADLHDGQIRHSTNWCVTRLTEIASALAAPSAPTEAAVEIGQQPPKGKAGSVPNNASGEPATAVSSHATDAVPPSPAPASVEGVVSHNSVGGLWANRVTVPPSWRLGQRVRITRLDPEAT